MLNKWLYKIIQTPTLISIIVGTLLVILQQINGGLDPVVQISFFVFYLFLTGIPHGAIDHLVEKETAKRQRKPFNLSVFLLKYLTIMAIYGLIWFVVPSFSLLFFLLISTWHFGETDIEKAPPTMQWNVTRFTFGCLVLSWILLMHPAETTPILERISLNSPIVMTTWFFLMDNSRLLLTCLIGFFTIYFAIAYKNEPILIDKRRLARLFIILLLTRYIPLLPAFALYFGGWHALSSFKTIQDYLVDEQSTSQNSFKTTLKIWSKTLLFTTIIFLFSAFATWYWLNFLQTWDPLPWLFIFLSLITLPHLNVMHKINKANV